MVSHGTSDGCRSTSASTFVLRRCLLEGRLKSITLGRNAVLNLVSFGTTTVINLLLVPLMLYYLGVVGFGIWAVVRAFVGYASVADLGLTSTVTKYIAEFVSSGDQQKIGSILKTAMVVYATIFLGILVAVWLGQAFIANALFSAGGLMDYQPTVVLVTALVVFAISMTFSVFQSALTAIQRMDLTNTVLTVAAILNGGLMYAALVTGTGLLGLVGANAIATVVSAAAHWMLFRRVFGKNILREGAVSIGHARTLLGYGKHVFVGALANNVHLHFDKLLLGANVGMTAVSSYEIGSRLVHQLRQVPILMLQPLLPAASDLSARRAHDSISEMYLRTLKYVIAGTYPLAGILAMVGSSFIEVWLGHKDPLAATTLRILLLSNAVNLITAPGYYIAIGLGKARLPMLTSVLGLVLNVGLSYELLRIFGYYGAVAGSFVSLIIASVVFIWIFHRSMGIPWTTVLRLSGAPLLSLAVCAATWVILSLILDSPPALLVSSILLSSAIYVTMLHKLSYFDSEDRAYAKRLMNTFFLRRQKELENA